MRILIDIGHPGQVYYFRNFINEMQDRGHRFFVIARDKDVTLDLLRAFKIPYFNRGKGGKTIISKILYLFIGVYKVMICSLKFKPDVFLSFGSIYAAYSSLMDRRPHISFDDNEGSPFKKMWTFASNVILTPHCYMKNLGEKHLHFNSYMELGHLHPNRFKPDSSVYNWLGIPVGSKYILLRFVSWKASHDIGQKGLTYKYKVKLVNMLSKTFKIFISSEDELPREFEKYRLKIPAYKLHDVLAFASLYIGEGSTTASECVILGTPSIYVNSITVCTCREQEIKYNTCFNFKNEVGVIEKAFEILNDDDFIDRYKVLHSLMMKDFIDLTAFMVWFFENWPDSKRILKENPKYQLRFK